MPSTLKDIQTYLDNRLPDFAGSKRLLAGSIGESPSKYSRSPGMWNAAFRDLEFDAAYVPFDVRSDKLESFIAALREYPGFIGANVTVPHKLAIMNLLDDVDPAARRIGAVNTFAVNEGGKLVGYNTDADGLIASMLRPLPGEPTPFLPSLSGMDVLLLGAGGAGRAAAFALGQNLNDGILLLTNRSLDKASSLATEVAEATGVQTSAISQTQALEAVAGVDLVVNASTVGQSGIRHLPDGMSTSLEAFSSLAPAQPVAITERGDVAGFWQEWFQLSLEAISRNNDLAAAALAQCKTSSVFVDAVYSPDETVLLRQARLAGHKTLNGKGMLIMQAAYSFINRMTRRHLEAEGHDPDTLYDRVVETMSAAF